MTAALVTPDADSLQAEFVNSFSATVLKHYTQYVAQSNSPYGFVQEEYDYTGNFSGAAAAAATGFLSAPWQQDFFTATYGWATCAGLNITSDTQSKLAAFFGYLAQSVVGRLGDPATGFNYTEAACYNINTGLTHTTDWAGGTGPWPVSWASIYSITSNVFAVGGAPNAFVNSTTALHQISTPEGEGYFANAMPAISYAVRLGASGAVTSYERLTGASNWSNMTTSFNSDACVWSVKPRTPAMPAWLATVAVNAWVAIPNTGQGGTAVDTGGGLTTNSRLSYSSFALRGTEVWYCCPGGHSDYQPNEVIACDIGLDTPVWQLRHAASPVIASSGAYEADGQPAASHLYNTVFWSKEVKRFIKPYTRFTDPNADSYPATNGFDPVTNTWDPAGTWADATGVAGVHDDNGNCYVIGQSYTDVARFQPSTNTWSTLFHGSTSIIGMPQAWDSKRLQIFSFCYGDGQGAGTPGLNAYVINSTTGVATAITFNTSSAYTAWLALQTQYQGMDYDPVADRFLVYCPINVTDSWQGNGGTTIYVILPNSTTTWDMTTLTVTGTPPVATVGSMTRFRYMPELGGFVCAPSGLAQMYFLKTTGYASSPAPSPSPSPPSPSPSPSPSPAPTPPAPAPSPDPDLIALIKLTDSGHVESVQGLTVTVTGTPTYDASAPGPAWQFTGSAGNCIEIDNFPYFEPPITIGTFWRQASANNIGSGVGIVGLNIDSDAKLLQVGCDSNNKITAWTRNVSTSTVDVATSATSGFAYDTWMMVAGVWASSSSRAAFDSGTGILSAASTATVDVSGTSAKLIVGAYPRSDLPLPIGGYEKYVFVYKRALTQAELVARAANPALIF